MKNLVVKNPAFIVVGWDSGESVTVLENDKI
jgi:hypothetical protein